MNKVIVGIIGATVVILVGIVLIAGKSAPSTKPELGEAIDLQPATHIPVGTSHPAYNSNPPTSGPHYADPAPWGIHTETVADETAIHNLEHGGIWVSYNPTKVDPATITQLKDLVRSYPSKVLLTSRAGDDVAIALASWGRLEKLDAFDVNKIQNFITANKNKGPEQVPDEYPVNR